MRAALTALALASAISITAPTASAQDAAAIARGKAYATQNCAGCHAVDDTRPSPNQAAASFREITNTPGMTPLAITVWLQTPHRLMPHIIVEPDDREDLIAFLTSLKSRE